MRADLTADYVRSLFHYDQGTGLLRWRAARGTKAAGSVAGTEHRDSHRKYFVIQIDRRMYQGHRIVWLHLYGEWPPLPLDHVDGNGLNNRPHNLRLATNSQNGANRRHHRPGKYPRGVKYDPRNGRYYAAGCLNRQWIHIGTFDTAEDAGAAFESWASAVFGEFYETAEARR